MSLFHSPEKLKEMFYRDRAHEKKYKALKNYADCSKKFTHKTYLPLLRNALDSGFLGEKEDEFLGYLIDRYSLPYLDWAHKTQWLKKEMKRISEQHEPQYTPSQPKPHIESTIFTQQTFQNHQKNWAEKMRLFTKFIQPRPQAA